MVFSKWKNDRGYLDADYFGEGVADLPDFVSDHFGEQRDPMPLQAEMRNA
jgi:hypothetical protein